MHSDQNSYESVSVSKLSLVTMDESANSQVAYYLLINIFKNLSLYDLYNCMKVCKTWYYYANDDTLWENIDFIHANKILNKIFMLNMILKYKKCLKRVSFHGCTNMTDEILKIFCSYKPNIYYLSLRYCDNITDIGIEYIEANIKNITHLDLSGCFNICNKGFELISKMSQLKYLNISWCHLIDNEILEENIKNLKNLETFIANGCTQILNYFVEVLLVNCGNLKKLSIINCINIGYRAFEHLQNSSKIEYLNIRGSVRSYDPLLDILAKKCHFLKCLILIDCRFHNKNLICLVKNCPNIQYLNLEGTGVNDEFLRELSRIANKLRFLGLSNALNVTDRGILFLSRSKLLCKSLEHIELDGSCNLTTNSINYMKSIKNLKILDIVDCPQFNSSSLKILQEANPKLIIHANIFIKRRELAYADIIQRQRSDKNKTKNRLLKCCTII